MNADMSDALMGEELTDPEPGMLDEPAPADGLELGAGDESELDPLFAADAQALFPDWDDDQLLNLQKLIDARASQLSAVPEPMEMEEPMELPEGDLGL
jgi:hypothetical protein